jgi:hypothetical protein
VKELVVKTIAGFAKFVSAIGLSKNECINIGGYRYPIAEITSYSDQKLDAVLKSHGLTEEQQKLAKGFIRGLVK